MGKTDRSNCGACHFYGGGGDGVKHGDLDSSLKNPEKSLDVHMDADGLNFQCTSCHTTVEHKISGRTRFQAASASGQEGYSNRISCESCHGASPHKLTPKLNDHTDKVACQTCHIPAFARGGNPTLMSWDWSTAGQFKLDGSMIVKKDDSGNVTYHTKKGGLSWDENVEPKYFWYNGQIEYPRIGEKIDDGKVVEINRFQGSYDDPESRIFPFKVHTGKQVYDKVNKNLVVPKLFGKKGTGAYWAEYDWLKACEKGMEAFPDVPFSGEIDFVDTVMYFPITHMIAPKEESLSCDACHSKGGLLANLSGFYLPGRDNASWLDLIGWAMIVGTLFGVIIHGSVRFYCRRKGVNL